MKTWRERESESTWRTRESTGGKQKQQSRRKRKKESKINVVLVVPFNCHLPENGEEANIKIIRQTGT